MKKVSTFLIFIILLESMSFSYAWKNCKYTSQIEECREANKSWSPLAIEEFLCVSEISDEGMVYNLILNDKFKKIDEAADGYLEYLENDKSRFFGPEQREPFFRWVDEIHEAYWKQWKFYKDYIDQLAEVRAEAVECLWWKTSVVELKNNFEKSNGVNNLIEDKLSRRRKVSVDILTLNKQQIRDDSSKKSMQIRRTMYDSVSNLFMINLWYLMRIMFKWASKTKNPY